MEIKYKNIVLRDMTESDIEDEIRWYTVETDWTHWDAPWEMEQEVINFNPEEHRQKELKNLSNPPDDPRWGFEIDTEDGKHIGSVSSYMITSEFEWISLKNAKPEEKLFRTVGIGICESSFCEKGFGTNALAAFIRYLLESGEHEIYTQTWSGNIRMVKLAEKLGFEICRRKENLRHVRGKDYDGLTFRLNDEKFYNYINKR